MAKTVLIVDDEPNIVVPIQFLMEQNGYDVIVTASGDGTANEAINGLMRARAAGFNHCAFSILPVGTGNDMAYGLGMRGTLEESIASLAKNHRKTIDIGLS